ncbi:MAG: ParB/Srx family N-terminal domain-containing protein [Gemmataceae bacterium]
MVAEDAAEAALTALNATLQEMGQPYKLALIDPASLKELDKNAHYMTHEVFQNLVANIQRDGALASVPFCWHDGTTFHVLSGNHRVKAAVAAGVSRILILYDDRPLSRQERVAIQLSHNAINGKDDPALLKELWAEIDDLSLKYYAGLDDKQLEQLADAQLKSMREAVLDYKSVMFLFLPEEVEALENAFQRAVESSVCEEAVTARLSEFSRLVDALDKTKASFAIKNHAVALSIVLDVFERHLTELQPGWCNEGTPKHKGLVPLATVFGSDKVPASVACLLREACAKMTRQGLLDSADAGPTLQVLAERFLAAEK